LVVLFEYSNIVSAGERRQTHVLDRAATETGTVSISFTNRQPSKTHIEKYVLPLCLNFHGAHSISLHIRRERT